MNVVVHGKHGHSKDSLLRTEVNLECILQENVHVREFLYTNI